MGWEAIENVKPVYSKSSVPADGVLVKTRRAMNDIRFIEVKVGGVLAKRARFHADEHKIRLLFGTGPDAGKIAVSLDQQNGTFLARKGRRNDVYTLTINRAAAEGLFSLEFEPFTVSNVEALRPENGQPPMFTFKASAQMLEVE